MWITVFTGIFCNRREESTRERPGKDEELADGEILVERLSPAVLLGGVIEEGDAKSARIELERARNVFYEAGNSAGFSGYESFFIDPSRRMKGEARASCSTRYVDKMFTLQHETMRKILEKIGLFVIGLIVGSCAGMILTVVVMIILK